MQSHCHLIWFHISEGLILFQGGIEPQYLFGVLQLDTMEITFKNKAYVDRLIERSEEHQEKWRASLIQMKLKETVYKEVDMEIQNLSPGTFSIDRGANTPHFEENHILPGSDLAPARIVLSTAQINKLSTGEPLCSSRTQLLKKSCILSVERKNWRRRTGIPWFGIAEYV